MHQIKACVRPPLNIRSHECSTPYTSDELTAIARDNIEVNMSVVCNFGQEFATLSEFVRQSLGILALGQCSTGKCEVDSVP
ncbi:uncharacterized protein PHACADRAFT_264906, partial [Phanerochaete carnosa HHB-10118-sp]